jgi:hypothetical protein
MVTDDYCCEECFKHPWLQAMARNNGTRTGVCFYCGAQGRLASIKVLHAGFRNLLSDYIPALEANGGGDSIFPSVLPINAIQRDWNLFTDHFISKHGTQFLAAVFRNQPLPNYLESFSIPVVAFHRNAMSTAYDKWLEFWIASEIPFSELATRNLEGDIDIPGTFVNQAAEHLRGFARLLPSGQKLWRARAGYVGHSPHWNCEHLPISEMGMNPKCPASRLNRDGEAVLYCAESEKTAVSEVRPGRGYVCTTCELTLARDIMVLDLASPLDPINPFTCGDLSWKLDLQRVALNLSASVAEPISRGEDVAVYSKTQFLSVIVRAMRLEGIRFLSSLDAPSGVNLALFDPIAVSFSRPGLVKITHTEVTYESFSPPDTDDKRSGHLQST